MNTQEQNLIQQWEHITITNDFVFCKVMEDPELLAELIRRILPGLAFDSLSVLPQKTQEDGLDTHGVRFDLFIKDESGRVIEMEMQVTNRDNLPLRIRFYSSMIDTQMLDKNEPYSHLKESYVIMICPFDLYGKGRHIYKFQNREENDHDLLMGDMTTKIVLNAAGTEDDISDKLKAFLDYVVGKLSDDEFIQKLDEAVKKARANKEWRRDYMTMRMRDLENQEEGEKRGREAKEREMIETMLESGRTPEEIADFCKIPLDRVKEVEEAMKNKAA